MALRQSRHLTSYSEKTYLDTTPITTNCSCVSYNAFSLGPVLRVPTSICGKRHLPASLRKGSRWGRHEILDSKLAYRSFDSPSHIIALYGFTLLRDFCLWQQP
jgi:hypothetical protein